MDGWMECGGAELVLCVQGASVTCSRAAPRPGSFQYVSGLVVPCSLEARAWINSESPAH